MSDNDHTTLKIIAGSANVSVTTVSRILSGKAVKYRISKKTQKNVHRIARDLKYEPNQVARALKGKQSHTIGVVIPDISNPFFASIVRQVENESRNEDYSVMVCDSQEDTEVEKKAIKILGTRKVDGMIICPVGIESNHIKEIVNRNIPVVIADRYFTDLDLSQVASDNYKGAIEAITHLIKKGHRQIAFIQGHEKASVNIDRVQGYKDAHQMNGLSMNKSFIVGENFGEHSGYIGTKILMSGSERPTAILAGGNLVSLGAMRAIWEDQLRIPDDVSMIAFDDHPYSEFLYTPMTTVKQKNEDIGKISIKLLFDEMNLDNHSDKKKIIIPTELIVRKSVKRMA